jgi:hypothetical protein
MKQLLKPTQRMDTSVEMSISLPGLSISSFLPRGLSLSILYII